MSDTREASWYEIALTHSQIVKIFVVLLLCLVGAFFSGVWIGRDAAATVQLVPPPPAAAEVADGREIAQLKFFSDDEVSANGAGDAEPRPAIPEPGAGTSMVDDLTSVTGP